MMLDQLSGATISSVDYKNSLVVAGISGFGYSVLDGYRVSLFEGQTTSKKPLHVVTKILKNRKSPKKSRKITKIVEKIAKITKILVKATKILNHKKSLKSHRKVPPSHS